MGSNCDAYYFQVDRGIGTDAPLAPYRSVIGATSLTDVDVAHGSAYRYRVRALGRDGTAGPWSQIVTVTSSDVTPPRRPLGLVATPTSGGATISSHPNMERDILGYHFHLAMSPAGPFYQLTTLPYSAAEPRSYVVTGLQPVPHCLKATAVDFAGNISADSQVASFVPAP